MGRQKNVDMSIIPEDISDKSKFEVKSQDLKASKAKSATASREGGKKVSEKKVKTKMADEKTLVKKLSADMKGAKSRQAEGDVGSKKAKVKAVQEKKPKQPLAEKKIKEIKKASKKSLKHPPLAIRKKSKHGKLYRQAEKELDKSKLYSFTEALKILPKTANKKFPEGVELHLKLATLKKGESIRGTLKLPHSTGKSIRIAALTTKPAVAKNAGASIAGSDDLIEKIKKGKIDFDILVAEPAMMAKIAPLAKILGPKGLMPNPKSGTISSDIKKTVKELAVVKSNIKPMKQAIFIY
jgi:large subunit ribosomal protein L1